MAAERTAPASLMPPNEAGGAVRLYWSETTAFQNGWSYGIGLRQQAHGSGVNWPWNDR
jgi:hypothetical protein